MAQTLGQLVAAEAAARSEANKRAGALAKAGQRADGFEGFTKTYEPFAETDGDNRGIQLPPEGKRVQHRAEEVVRGILREMSAAVDLSAAKDTANCNARADVTVDGEVLLEDVPATHLLHMEHVLDEIAGAVAKLPVRDPSVEWAYDPDTRLSGSPVTFTNREEVRPVAMVVVAPTKEHPGQGTTYQERVAVGRWNTVRYTGALTEERKRDLERRLSELKVAFKQAREAANRVEAPAVSESAVLWRYILGD